jgi:dTDP-4-dehydrorhamnose 3,5-epimerase
MYKVIERKTILVEDGNVKHGLKSSDESFVGFGEVYFTEIKKDKIKGWKRHSKMTLNLLPVLGRIILYFKREFDDIPEEVHFGVDDYKLVCVEPNVWLAFEGVGDKNVMANVASIEHDPAESENVPYGQQK